MKFHIYAVARKPFYIPSVFGYDNRVKSGWVDLSLTPIPFDRLLRPAVAGLAMTGALKD